MTTEVLQPLPYYLVNGEKIRMSLENFPQPLLEDEFTGVVNKIDLIYGFLRRLRQAFITNPNLLSGFPQFSRKAPALSRQLEQAGFIPEPRNAITRMDVVGAKVVDINNKPAGFGLTLAAYQRWEALGVWGYDQPLLPDVKNLLPGEFAGATVVTEARYPFVSDQRRIAKILTPVTGRCWEMKYLEAISSENFIKAGQAVFGFSYGEGNDIYQKAILENPDLFLVNPATALFWDNKAFMSLPFMDVTTSIALADLSELRLAFPATYLFKADPTNYESVLWAKELNDTGIRFEPLTRDNVPIPGESYLKPLGESGGRGVVFKRLNDWGSVMSAAGKFARNYPEGFIIQQRAAPSTSDGYAIKDGYFMNTYHPKAQFLALERMGTTEQTPKIHGGSKTKLIPVYLERC